MGAPGGGHTIFWGGTGSSLPYVVSIPQFPYEEAPGGGGHLTNMGARAPLSYATVEGTHQKLPNVWGGILNFVMMC